MTILDTIVEEKRREVAELPTATVTVDRLRFEMQRRGRARPFLSALARPVHGSMALIAEVKKASPSAGVIRPDFDPVAIAREYEISGASCLSVLTDRKFFQGSLEYLERIREAVRIPLLRKDFIIDERQILEAVEAGADAILLIAAVLDDERLKHFHDLASEAGLAALVEVHDEVELERALAIQAPLIGVNNRDLKTFEVDLGTTERLARRIRETGRFDADPPVLLVAESGIHSHDDVRRLESCGARAILVGESLMRAGDGIQSKVKELVGRVGHG
jgi:indole-3-glycerol phosphate synthase